MGNRFASTIVKKLSSDVVPEILRFTLRCLRLDELSWVTRHQFPVTQMSINAGKPTWISAIKVFTITFKSGKKKKNSQSELAEPGHSRLGQSMEYNEGFRDEDLTHQLLSAPKQQFKIGVDMKLNVTMQRQGKGAACVFRSYLEII